MRQRVTYKIGNEELILETGHLAKQANGYLCAIRRNRSIGNGVCVIYGS
mgnify:CR=1 FL=1